MVVFLYINLKRKLGVGAGIGRVVQLDTEFVNPTAAYGNSSLNLEF